jgi:hypothetical protein
MTVSEMAVAAKKQQPVDLGGEILRLRGQVEAFIDGKVQELKRSRDGAGLPPEILRQQLTGGLSQLCECRAALKIIQDQGR